MALLTLAGRAAIAAAVKASTLHLAWGTGDGSNGDFITFRDCNINFNIVNYADGHADARNTNFYNCRLDHCHTSFDSLTYGNQSGSLAVNANGCSFEDVYRVFNINLGGSTLQGGYSAKLDSCYGEALVSLGNAFTVANGKPGGIAINESKFAFTLRSNEYSPVYVLNSSSVKVNIRNTHFNGGYGFHNFNGILDADNLIIDKLQDDVFSPASGKAYKVSKSFTCGIWANSSRTVYVSPHEFYTYFGYALTSTVDSEAFRIDLDASTPAGTGLGYPIPWFVNNLVYGKAKTQVSGIAPVVLNRATYNLSSVILSNADYTFTCDNAFITDAAGANTDAPFYVGKGDIVVDSVSGHVFFIISVSFSGTGPGTTMTATMRQLNNIKRTGSFTFSAGGNLPVNSGTLTFYNARRVYPSQYRVNFTATSGSGSVAHKICGDESPVNFMILPVAVNDYLISSRNAQSAVDSVFPKFSKVTAVNVNDGSVTLNQNARRSFYGETPLYVKVL